MKSIPLTRGYVATVDDADFEALSRGKWYARIQIDRNGTKSVYAAGRLDGQTVLMHRVLVPGASMVDHWDGDGLNNTRVNLRPCTKRQNSANSEPNKKRNRTSMFKGVFRGKYRWMVQINIAP